MPKAVFNNTIIAQSDDTILLEGIHYFPPGTVRTEYLRPSETTKACSWKGEAHYFHVAIGNLECRDGAWHYPEPSRAATAIKDHIAFWKDVEVIP